ncbi:MAG: pirin family protein [Candidatus Aminicenantes bacterium]|nr:pirin family protein [Candidatus Aminicenantes bacterium]
MDKTRRVGKILRSKPTIEGAGVHLRRAFGFYEAPLLDPFLMLDDFGSEDPRDYILGFPWHPHRGIETVTYVLEGEVDHEDSLGNRGRIGPGDVQWMTAGSGIIHQEMPQSYLGTLRGLQLWVNLPASHKMMDPRYRDVRQADIPVVSPAPGVKVKVVCGSVGETHGPVRDLVAEPEYLDVQLEPEASFVHPARRGHRVLAYVLEGRGTFAPGAKASLGRGELALYGDGDEVRVESGEAGVRFLFLAGRPLNEPVAWYGPIVMNTEAELDLAFREFRGGTFVKRGRA